MVSLNHQGECCVEFTLPWSQCWPDWLVSYRGFPQSSRQMLCWIYITVPSWNPSVDQIDLVSYRGFPQSSRQMLCWIYITVPRSINISHKIYITNFKTICKRTQIRDESHRVVLIPGGRLLWNRDANCGPTAWQMYQLQSWLCAGGVRHSCYDCFFFIVLFEHAVEGAHARCWAHPSLIRGLMDHLIPPRHPNFMLGTYRMSSGKFT